MDKCREEFEVIARSNGWNLTTYPEITERIDYVNNLTEQAWQMYQHQQAKVEGLKATIKGNHGRIAELERLNRVKAQAILDLHQEIKELKASHHGEVIGHEVHLKNIKQERDELQKRVDQQGLIIANVMSIASDLQKSWSMFEIGKKLEQALKGEGL
ncbi:hypothetical protein [Acinetobacter baumannii]|uniref:hypothetical protein n=2 Tax=Acinetobacter baumannii TaxID=470 RepID=UPI0001AEF180|nr:hypothetical protein [Acinetobacter baumannii]EHU1917926.1 hypothetical protein [Acinetobacter baumannii]EHU1962579.1 hypothetical protein [Acinetobacter baumannii]EKP45099.1 hypothetical protein ACIN5111_2617 [Acinetobacter baumannii OIFC111]EXB42700.1 hypothetical protein J544_1347 [Acinetobacter baumannii 1461963]EXH45722.1 hypothetical protein J651_0324 [Acinetobacter baumannii 1293320]